MISQTIVTLLLINEAANILAASGEINTEYVPAARTKRFNEPVCEPYGLDNRLFQNGGYCKDILGNRPVYGSSLFELYENEQKMRRYQMATYLLLKQRQNLTEEQKNIRDKFFWVRQSCLEEIDDIYCHHYFKRCYFSSSPQPVCREACEELTFKRCDREFKMVIGFNTERLTFPDWPFYWDIINCTILPFRNESRNCYYPDKIREKLNVLENEDCFYGDGRGYRGNISTTVSGYTCQSWDAQYPHEHQVLNGSLYKEIRNSSNFCRNPGGFGLHGPWCFTTNRTIRWEYCDVPCCPKQPPSHSPADFRGHNLSSTAIKIFWGDVPKSFVNGILLGFHVTCKRHNSSNSHFVDLAVGDRNWEFNGLQKFTNYSCRLRAFNNFGNGTWSEELVISTDEDVPSAPPESLKAWNLSSTSVQVQWGSIPFGKRHGKIVGYNVKIIPQQQKQGRRTSTYNYTTSRSLRISGLKKYSKYVISICALTRRGRGPSRVLTVQTDEDVPDHPPTDITAFSLGTNAVQIEWQPVPPEYRNGEVTGYKVHYGDVNAMSRSNRIVPSSTETRLKISDLKPKTNYSFQILAFTGKGDGPSSANYFARTGPDEKPSHLMYQTSKPRNSVTGPITAAMFSGLVAFVAAILVIYFVRKRRKSQITTDGNSSSCHYAISPPDWIEQAIAASRYHGYETLDDENVPMPTAPRQPRYRNITSNGSLDLPPYLRNIFLEFEQLYENTKYKRLNWRRRSLGGAVDVRGHPVYDKLQRMISPTASYQGSTCNHNVQTATAAESSQEQLQHHSVSLGELRGFVQALQGGECNGEMMEMHAAKQARPRHRRRFSVDLGEVREFIALTEMRVSATDESNSLAEQQPGVE